MLGRSKRSSFLFPSTKAPIVEEERGMLSETKNKIKKINTSFSHATSSNINVFQEMCNTPSLMDLLMLDTVQFTRLE